MPVHALWLEFLSFNKVLAVLEGGKVRFPVGTVEERPNRVCYTGDTEELAEGLNISAVRLDGSLTLAGEEGGDEFLYVKIGDEGRGGCRNRILDECRRGIQGTPPSKRYSLNITQDILSQIILEEGFRSKAGCALGGLCAMNRRFLKGESKGEDA